MPVLRSSLTPAQKSTSPADATSKPTTPAFALAALQSGEEDRTLRAVLVGMLREAD